MMLSKPIVFTLFLMLSLSVKSQPDFRDCSKEETTFSMRECISKEYKIADTELNKKYATLVTLLPPIGQETLKESQRAWIQFRDTDCAWQAFQNYQGSLFYVITDSCFLEMTKKRVTDLQNNINYYRQQ
ncbi:MAG: lysozyme inhibitor LprI family protein [Legionella sp.]|nr:lysozyme inhibitor LprI family protein [Legionella sp.]